MVSILYDSDGKLERGLAEYCVLTEDISNEEKRKYGQFIEDQIESPTRELAAACEESIAKRRCALPVRLPGKASDLKKTAFSVFQRIYEKAATFPFDKIHTGRGKAAASCRETTVELVKGKLGYEWYATRPPELQNRAKTVLFNGWRVFEDDRIALYPGRPGLREIFDELDDRLEKEESLRLGEVFSRLLSPPYGFNVASAGLLIGVFVSPRLEMLGFVYRGTGVTPSNWINQAMPKNFFERARLEETELKKVETDEWKSLLFRWETEPTHAGRADFLIQAEKLEDRVPVSSEALSERSGNLKEKAAKSLDTLRNFKKLRRRLKMFRDDFSFFEDLNVSNEELEKRVAARIGEVEEEDEGEELAGEWRSPAEIYGAMLETLLEKRRSGQWTGAVLPSPERISAAGVGECGKMLAETGILPLYLVEEDSKRVESCRGEIRNRLSGLWFSEAWKEPDEIAKTGLVQCQELLSRTETVPDYATEEHRLRVGEMRSALMERLDKYKVAGLVVRFRQLSPDMQEQFLKIAVKEFKRSREAAA